MRITTLLAAPQGLSAPSSSAVIDRPLAAPIAGSGGPKLPPPGPDRDLALLLLDQLAASGPTGRREVELLNQAAPTIRFREGTGAEYGGTIEDGDNTITIGRAAQNDPAYAAEILAHETGHQIYSMLHLDEQLRAADVDPDNGAGRLVNEAFASAYGNQVRRDQGRSPDLGHGSNLREDYLKHLDPNGRLGKFYVHYYEIDLNDPATQRIRDVTSKAALRSLVPILRQAGVREEYLQPGLEQ